jgi:type I restriction enzyme S subunit
MARRIYEEWFVRFCFPGHENVGTTESELGLIPVGWKISTVADTFDVLGGGTPPTSVEEYWHDGSINWYAPTDLTRSGQVFIDESGDKITPLGLAKSSARMFPAFSVMMTSRATLGVIAINTTEACTNQGFINCIPSKRFPLYVLFHWLKQNVGLFISLATGATFKEITKGNFKQIKLLLPPAILINRFQNLVEPMMQQLLNLQRKNSNLRRTRDLLLPKLISGEIDISNFPEPITD